MSQPKVGLVFLIVLIAASVSVRLLNGQPKRSAEKTKAAPAATKQSTPESTVAKPADAALAAEIDRILGSSDTQHARFGIFVTSLSDGRVIYAHDSDKLFVPASNMKVYTTAVSLDLLGADYRWRTSVYGNK